VTWDVYVPSHPAHGRWPEAIVVTVAQLEQGAIGVRVDAEVARTGGAASTCVGRRSHE
jgi:hypothetical protein